MSKSSCKAKILIACHKEYDAVADDVYTPIYVGNVKTDSENFIHDRDKEDNISDKNPYFCELTALYYGYKNIDCDYIGLVHYRKYLGGNKKVVINGKSFKILSKEELEKLFSETDVILPKKRNYFISNLYSHYKSTMYVEPLDVTGEIIKEKYPEYYKEFSLLKKRTTTHLYNMFIMKKTLADEYCKWLFDILFELEKRVDKTKYNSFHARFFGRISELLLDVFLRTKEISFKEVKVVHIERVNWIKKIYYFLIAKFLGRKNEKSL